MTNADKIMRNAWNEISQGYQNRYKIGIDKIHYGPLCPSEDKLKLIGAVNGKEVLELGSGAGQNSIHLSRLGANVTAIDISEEQIKYGELLAKKNQIKVNFIRSSFMEFTKKLYINKFDIVLSVYALQYLYDMSEQNKVFKAIFRSLRPNGKFIFSIGHPINSRGYWDKNNNFVLDNYYDHSIKRWSYSFPEIDKSPTLECNFKTIEDYFISLNKAGFVVEKVLEPKPIKKDSNSLFGVKSHFGTNSKNDKFSYAHSSRIPVTLIIQARKLPKQK